MIRPGASSLRPWRDARRELAARPGSLPVSRGFTPGTILAAVTRTDGVGPADVEVVRQPPAARSSREPRSRLESQTLNVRPMHDRVFVQRFEKDEQRVGEIIIPDTARERPQRGRVVAAGSGRITDDGRRVPLGVRTGDLVLFGKYSGQEIELEGQEYLILKEDEVLAIIEDEAIR